MFVTQGSKKLFITLGFPARLEEKAFAVLGYRHGHGTEVWVVHDGKQTITQPSFRITSITHRIGVGTSDLGPPLIGQ